MEAEELLTKISKILEDHKIPYLITGGIAVSLWGRPRATFDIDIVIELKEPKIPLLIKSLRAISKAGYVDEDTAREAIRRKGEFNFIDSETGLKVDFWIRKDDSVSRIEFKRRISKKIDGQKIYFISPEDLILRKLCWYKETGSTRHLEDAKSILKIQKNINLKYLRHRAERQSTLSKSKIKNKKSLNYL